MHEGVHTVVATEDGGRLWLELEGAHTFDHLEAEVLTVVGSSEHALAIDHVRAREVYVQGSGSAELTLDELYVDHFEADLTGGADAWVGYIEADTLDVHQRGSSALSLAGYANELQVDLAGNATLDGEQLVVDEAHGSIGGNASVTIDVEGLTDIDLRGAANLDLL